MSEEHRLSIIQHLEELRSRLIVSLIAILVTTALAYVFSDAILEILTRPAGGLKLVALSPMDGFMIRFRVALYGGLALAAPVWIYQLVRYLEPGLLPHEKRYIIPGVAGMVVLFLLGNIFGYIMLANMLTVMLTMFGSTLTYLPSADQYISFVVYFLIAVGVSFELPIVILILMKLGLVSPEFLRKQRRVAYFILFVFAELVTPVSDPIVAPMVVMLPMVILFELALLLSRFMVSKPKPTSAAVTSPGGSE
ncbi:MAG: twin-arginine translocase subunit TatC [Chloroflexota bacterium]|nr:twin-arginine translocase subunit TatC [Chloroflexota bacterium]